MLFEALYGYGFSDYDVNQGKYVQPLFTLGKLSQFDALFKLNLNI